MVIIRSAHPTAQWMGVGCDFKKGLSMLVRVRRWADGMENREVA